MRRRLAVLAAALACAAAPAMAGCGGGDDDGGDSGGAPAAPAVSPLELAGKEALGPGFEELTVKSPALAERTKVRVLLPRGYEGSGESYPVLYLLHGAGAGEEFWTTAGIASLVGGLPLIVVMPDGDTGFYSDWFNEGEGGPPRWETYHVDELIPFVDSRYRTRADGSGRAVAGASMGGLGALLYSARHPGTFAFAASLSGAVEVEPVPMAELLLATGRDPGYLEPIWGPLPEQRARWDAHDPVELAPALDATELAIATGTGDRPGRGRPDRVERVIYEMNLSLHRRLDQLGIEHGWTVYDPGLHDVPFWLRGLRAALPPMMETLGSPISPGA